jgi:glycine/D-amino acid oxidase-like deaminating enzyme
VTNISRCTHGLWAETAPPLSTGWLRGSRTTEVLVIGGGFTGLSTALHLSGYGISVVVIEAADIGFGGSGRNFGLVNAGLWVEPDTVVELLGETHGERLLQLLSEAPALVFEIIRRHGIACEGRNSGTLHCAVGRKGREEIERRFRQWHSRGAPVQLLNETESANKLGTAAYTGSLLDRRAGTIQPLAYVRGLARAALRQGARIFTGDAVERVERYTSGWTAITAQGAVRADWIVVATDIYAAGPWREVAQEQIRLPFFNVASAPLARTLRESILPEGHGAWDTRTVLNAFRVDSAGRLIFGSVGALRGNGRAIHSAWAKRAIRMLFPQLSGVEFESQWYGTIGMTTDNVPRLHKLASNVISVSGYNGRGIAPGTAFGRVIADYIRGAYSDADLPLPLTAVKEPRFRGLREAAYEFGSQIVHLLSSN